MDRNKERVLACALMCALFLVGTVCYAFFPVEAETPPDRVLLSTKGKAAKVIFDHAVHADEYAECTDCHHLWEEEDIADIEACTSCHEREMDEDDDIPNRYDAFHSQCLDCHEENDADLGECSNCHVK